MHTEPQTENRRKASLTDEDREAIADILWNKMKDDLYINAGKGFVNVVIKMIIVGIMALAVLGYAKGWFSL